MAAPLEFRAAFLAALKSALPQLIEAAWESVERKSEHKPAQTPRQRAASLSGRRIQKGRVRLTVLELITQNDAKGLSRNDIRNLIGYHLHLDGPISESTLKLALMTLRSEEKIETRNSRWHLAPPSYQKGKR